MDIDILAPTEEISGFFVLLHPEQFYLRNQGDDTQDTTLCCH